MTSEYDSLAESTQHTINPTRAFEPEGAEAKAEANEVNSLDSPRRFNRFKCSVNDCRNGKWKTQPFGIVLTVIAGFLILLLVSLSIPAPYHTKIRPHTFWGAPLLIDWSEYAPSFIDSITVDHYCLLDQNAPPQKSSACTGSTIFQVGPNEPLKSNVFVGANLNQLQLNVKPIQVDCKCCNWIMQVVVANGKHHWQAFQRSDWQDCSMLVDGDEWVNATNAHRWNTSLKFDPNVDVVYWGWEFEFFNASGMTMAPFQYELTWKMDSYAPSSAATCVREIRRPTSTQAWLVPFLDSSKCSIQNGQALPFQVNVTISPLGTYITLILFFTALMLTLAGVALHAYLRFGTCGCSCSKCRDGFSMISSATHSELTALNPSNSMTTI